MYEDKRETVRLSDECWNCLESIRDVGYSTAFTFFFLSQIDSFRKVIRKSLPDIKGDWVRYEYQGKQVTFTLSEQAMVEYRPRIEDFNCFAAAVKILGLYEDYVHKIIQISCIEMPQKMKLFEETHRNLIRKKGEKKEGFIKYELGRGIDFFQELFGFEPLPLYRPVLQFFFELRNLTVHQSGIVTKRLCDIMDNPCFTGTKLKVGDRVQWNLGLFLQLQHLLTQLLPEIDPLICLSLNLSSIEKQAYWYVGKLTQQ